jgi:hypothetical protein
MSLEQHGSFASQVKKVSGKVQETVGQKILFVADLLYPVFLEGFKNSRDANGLLLQPAKVRSMSLNVAQELVRKGKF